ncbi:MAG TPA: hypothetical protein VGW38_00515 [Chloroflexota bacterium]|nr:hypothetical protein [Chloroflexota bacterium]
MTITLLPAGWMDEPDPFCYGCGGTGWLFDAPCSCVSHTPNCEPGMCEGHWEEFLSCADLGGRCEPNAIGNRCENCGARAPEREGL